MPRRPESSSRPTLTALAQPAGSFAVGTGTGLGFSAADLILKSLGLNGFQEAAQRAQLDGLLVLWHPAR